MNPQYLHPPSLIRQTNLNMHLQPPRPHQGIINEILPICHPNQQYIIELIHSIQLTQQLINHTIPHARPPRTPTPPLLTNSIQLIKNNNMQTGIVAFLFVLLFCVGEEFADVLLALSHILI